MNFAKRSNLASALKKLQSTLPPVEVEADASTVLVNIDDFVEQEQEWLNKSTKTISRLKEDLRPKVEIIGPSAEEIANHLREQQRSEFTLPTVQPTTIQPVTPVFQAPVIPEVQPVPVQAIPSTEQPLVRPSVESQPIQPPQPTTPVAPASPATPPPEAVEDTQSASAVASREEEVVPRVLSAAEKRAKQRQEKLLAREEAKKLREQNARIKAGLRGKKSKKGDITEADEAMYANASTTKAEGVEISTGSKDNYEKFAIRPVYRTNMATLRWDTWLDEAMTEAIALNASDMHISTEGKTNNIRVRIRIDGVLQEFDYLENDSKEAPISTPAIRVWNHMKGKVGFPTTGDVQPAEELYPITVDGEERRARAVLFTEQEGGQVLVMRLPLVGPLRTLDELAFADYNLKLVKDLLANPYQLTMLAGPMGSGKGSPKWEKILTPSGWTTYGDIKVGDKVIGANGKPTTVTGVFKRGVLPTYKVALNDGTEVVVDGTHLWAVQNADDRHHGKPYRVMDTSTLAESQLRNPLSNNGHSWFIPVVAPVEFAPAELNIHPYVLGVLLGDGSFNGRGVNLTTVDEDIVARVNTLLPSGVSMRLLDSAPSRQGKAPHYNVVSDGKRNALLREFRELGLLGKNSSAKFVPEKYLFSSVEDRLELLRGLMDSDGDASGEFSTTSPMLKDAVVFLVQSLGGTAQVATRNSTYTYKGEKKKGRLSFRVKVKLDNFNPFFLKRKAEAWNPPSKYEVARAITSITPSAPEEIICISVAADDQLYVANHFIVTHNTTTAHGALLEVSTAERSVWSIEDPVERKLPNIVQLEIDNATNMTFDTLLPRLLRADYNTLFIGEIRDHITAEAGVKQAKAGRQVLSTIHADDNIFALMRLIDLAQDTPLNVLSAVGGVISQRLVRTLNPDWDGIDPKKKYKGRIPVHEILFVESAMIEAMMDNSSLSRLRQVAADSRGSTFKQDAERLIRAGITDYDELLKVLGPDALEGLSRDGR